MLLEFMLRLLKRSSSMTGLQPKPVKLSDNPILLQYHTTPIVGQKVISGETLCKGLWTDRRLGWDGVAFEERTI